MIDGGELSSLSPLTIRMGQRTCATSVKAELYPYFAGFFSISSALAPSFSSRSAIIFFKIATTGSPRPTAFLRSEEHTSELQSQSNLVCRLLLEKKKKT